MSARDVITEAVAEEKQTEIGSPVAELVIQRLLSAGYVIERGWQPIETAPRDETRVLVFAPAAGSEYPASAQRVDRWHNGGWGQMRTAQPYTLWRPLPATPEETSDAP
jgi:hypothetical protein